MSRMTSGMCWKRTAGMAVLMVLLGGASTASAQKKGGGGSPPPAPGTGTNEPITSPNISSPGILAPIDTDALPTDPEAATRAHMAELRVREANDDRHKRLQADVAKLVALTNELKTQVDSTTKDELSVEVVKKAQQIEKLAHDVQSRMRN